MLIETRDNKSGWRQFSFKDLVYLRLIAEARRFGVKNEQLKKLKNQLYKEKDDLFKSDLFYGEYAIISALTGIRVGWILHTNGDSFFTDMPGLAMLHGSGKPEGTSYLFVNLNQILVNIFTVDGKRERNPVPDAASMLEMIEEDKKKLLSKKEGEILDIYRKKQYTKIVIDKKENGGIIVYGESVENGNNLTEKDLLKLLSERNYSNIKVHKRDGKVVSYKLEDVFKL